MTPGVVCPLGGLRDRSTRHLPRRARGCISSKHRRKTQFPVSTRVVRFFSPDRWRRTRHFWPRQTARQSEETNICTRRCNRCAPERGQMFVYQAVSHSGAMNQTRTAQTEFSHLMEFTKNSGKKRVGRAPEETTLCLRPARGA